MKIAWAVNYLSRAAHIKIINDYNVYVVTGDNCVLLQSLVMACLKCLGDDIEMNLDFRRYKLKKITVAIYSN